MVLLQVYPQVFSQVYCLVDFQVIHQVLFHVTNQVLSQVHHLLDFQVIYQVLFQVSFLVQVLNRVHHLMDFQVIHQVLFQVSNQVLSQVHHLVDFQVVHQLGRQLITFLLNMWIEQPFSTSALLLFFRVTISLHVANGSPLFTLGYSICFRSRDGSPDHVL